MKEKNHFVWQYYLKSWTNEHRMIFCKREGRIIETGTAVLANERYFYKLDKLSLDDILFIKKIFCNEKNRAVLEINTSWLDMFKIINELVKIKENIKNKKIQNDINIYVTEFNENIHTSIENSAIGYLDKLYNEDLKFYKTEEDNIGFNIFLCEQYFRTKRMKDSILSTRYRLSNINLENCLNIGAHILAINLAYTLSTQRQHFKCFLLKNNTDTSFITSGQPVINIAGDNANPRTLTINEFEFYYPITPRLAFGIGIKENLLRVSEKIELEELNVKKYNDKMKSQCTNLLFSNKRKELV